MTRAKAVAALWLCSLALSACDIAGAGVTTRPDTMPKAATQTAAAPTPATPAVTAPVGRPAARGLQAGGQTAAQLDKTSAAEKAAATAPSSGGGKLGTTVASLGDATQSGFWIKTPLVKAAGKGRIVNPANGKSANVDLQPLGGGGAGSQISLAAMQALGIALTDLPEIEVWRN